MTTSELHSLLYPLPSQIWRQRKPMRMQMLHLNAASRHTGTSAPAGPYFTKSDPSSASWLGPYLHRTYWLLRNNHGLFLADLQGMTPEWVQSPNDVPGHHRFTTYIKAKSVWAHLCASVDSWVDGVSLKPIDFYAHCSTPCLWCALDD